MNIEDIMKYERRKNTSIYNPVNRDDFVCLKINIPKNSRWMKRVIRKAEEIMPGLNVRQANSSEERPQSIKEIDALSGIIAEYACEEVLRWRYGKELIVKPKSDTAWNQIDLKLYNAKTIEVRSSCVRNGIDFALFSQNKKAAGEQYFDIIGPYSNEYKKYESYKDYYMRVLYECDKRSFMRLLDKPMLELYITGGATKGMMKNSEFYQIKHLTPEGSHVERESDYRVIPLGKSLDINEFFEVLEKENEKLVVINR